MFRLMPYYFGAGCCFVTGVLPTWPTCLCMVLPSKHAQRTLVHMAAPMLLFPAHLLLFITVRRAHYLDALYCVL
jgi:hypothetical protein